MASKKKGWLDTETALYIFISLLCMALSATWYSYQVNTGNKLDQKLVSKRKQIKERYKYNAAIEAKNTLSAGESNLDSTEADAKRLFQALFQYTSWKTYTERVQGLAKDYPLLAENSLVDTTGSNAGTGSSPKSTYKIDHQLVNQDEQTMTYLITQTVSATNLNYVKNYYLKVKGEGESFNVIDFAIEKPLTRIGS